MCQLLDMCRLLSADSFTVTDFTDAHASLHFYISKGEAVLLSRALSTKIYVAYE